MTNGGFGAEEVRLGEALHRCSGHGIATVELYTLGRPADALLQAARPISDVLPWVETELRSYPTHLAKLTSAIATLGAGVRGSVSARRLERSRRHLDGVVAAFVADIVGPDADSAPYLSSVAARMLGVASDLYERAVQDESLDAYRGAYAAATRGRELLTRADGLDVAGIAEALAMIVAALPSADPPEQLVQSDRLADAVHEIATLATQHLGARSFDEAGLDEALAKIERVLADVVAAYEGGVPALAARLAASLFVRAYDPVREEVARRDQSAADRLTALLGVDLRKAINDAGPTEQIKGLADEALALVAEVGRGGDGAPDAL